MDINDLAKRLEGMQTISSISKIFNIERRTAINYIWELRKKGYVKTEYASNKKRIYRISLKKSVKGHSLYEIINKNSKVKLIVREDYIIHSDKQPTIEEVLARAVATKSFRTVLASLGLFNKINDWSRLNNFSEKFKIEKKIGALYDVAKIFIRVKKMDERTRNSFLRKKRKKEFIVENIKSKHFQDIEKRWNVYVPFNKQDLEVYKE